MQKRRMNEKQNLFCRQRNLSFRTAKKNEASNYVKESLEANIFVLEENFFFWKTQNKKFTIKTITITAKSIKLIRIFFLSPFLDTNI